MQNQSHESAKKEKINFNIDEFDIESYDFKPVTKGLGFHGEKETTRSLKVSEVKLKPSVKVTSSSTPIKSGYLNNVPTVKGLSPSLTSGLDAIYNRDKIEVKKTSKTKTEVKAKPKFTAAAYSELILAYLVDLFIVSLVTLILFTTFYALVFKEINLMASVELIKRSWDFSAIFFSLVYISYFTILGPIDSVGKKAVNISQRDLKSKKRVSIKQSFTCTLISLISIPLLFLPLLFDVHNKIAGTKTYLNEQK